MSGLVVLRSLMQYRSDLPVFTFDICVGKSLPSWSVAIAKVSGLRFTFTEPAPLVARVPHHVYGSIGKTIDVARISVVGVRCGNVAAFNGQTVAAGDVIVRGVKVWRYTPISSVICVRL